jgi:hypothetical protein
MVANSTGANTLPLPEFTFQTSLSSSALIDRLKIHNGGDISFYEDTGTTPKFVWSSSAEKLTLSGTGGLDVNTATGSVNIQAGSASADIALGVGSPSTANKVVVTAGGNVGIGTSSPATALDARGGVNSAHATFTGQASRGLVISTANTLSNDDGVVYNAQTVGSGKHIFQTAGSERMRIDSSGNVGIGTSSPTYKLDVAGNARANYFALRANESAPSESAFVYRPATGVLGFGTGTVERMRIDASGNLLVGSSSASGSSSTGVRANAGGNLLATASGTYAGYFNRLGSDGEVIKILKDGTTVGSINCSSGRLAIGNGDTGLKFGDSDNAVMPFNVTTNANRDAAVDLGYPSVRFKDLYLSGGVYLGGTGAANKLDDYEEGTFTPVVSGTSVAGAGTYTIQSGKYVIVGQMVYVSARLGWSAHTGSGNMVLAGLPNTANNEYANLGVVFRDGLTVSSGHTVNVGVVPSTNYANILEISTGTDNASVFALDTAVSDIAVSGWYRIA